MKNLKWIMTQTTRCSYKGFTLFEILIVLSIIAVLASLATPSFYAYSAQSEAKATIQKLSSLVRLARNHAINHQRHTLLCPSEDGINCGQNWQDGVLIFEDKNNDQQLNDSEAILYFQKSIGKNGTIRWTALRNHLSFSGQGLSNGNAGSFIYCPSDNNSHYAHALIISFSGKMRQAADTNQDGIRESGNTKNIACT